MLHSFFILYWKCCLTIISFNFKLKIEPNSIKYFFSLSSLFHFFWNCDSSRSLHLFWKGMSMLNGKSFNNNKKNTYTHTKQKDKPNNVGQFEQVSCQKKKKKKKESSSSVALVCLDFYLNSMEWNMLSIGFRLNAFDERSLLFFMIISEEYLLLFCI